MPPLEVLGSELESEHDAVFLYKGELFTGKAVEYNSNGIKVWEATFLEGVHHGIERNWFNDGTLESEQEFVDGEGRGFYRSWYRNGQMCMDAQFERGVAISKKKWAETGGLLYDWLPGQPDPDLQDRFPKPDVATLAVRRKTEKIQRILGLAVGLGILLVILWAPVSNRTLSISAIVVGGFVYIVAQGYEWWKKRRNFSAPSH